MNIEEICKLLNNFDQSEMKVLEFQSDDYYVKIIRDHEHVVDVNHINNNEEKSLNLFLEKKDTEQLQSSKKTIVSTMNGVFFRSSKPEERPFASVNQRIECGQVVGIIESMKMFNEIESDFDGVVTEVLIKDGDDVEIGTPLLIMEVGK